MNSDSINMAGKQNGKYITAAILAAIAIALFLFTLYNGLK